MGFNADLVRPKIGYSLFDELGYFSESECQRIKEIMDGKSFMDFDVSWSNQAGNCILIVATDYYNNPTREDAEEVKRFFISCFMRESVRVVEEVKKFVTKRFIEESLGI